MHSNGHGSDTISIVSISQPLCYLSLMLESTFVKLKHQKTIPIFQMESDIHLLELRHIIVSPLRLMTLTVSHRYLLCLTTVSSHGRNTNQMLIMEEKCLNLLQTVS